MDWKYNPDEPAPKPKKRGRKPKPKYVAVVGINFDKFNLRVNPGELVPEKCLEDKSAFNWLLHTKKAIRAVGGDHGVSTREVN